MMRSMFAGISGLRSHQTMMDVVGNNIANVNTAGFKTSVVTFQEALSQTLQGPVAAGAENGGSNPVQIGLGARVASIDAVFTQGATQVTGRSTDLAIQGSGFFVLDTAGSREYTRSGNFGFDSQGNLTGPSGSRVMGWLADSTGNIDLSASIEAVQIPLSQVIDPVITTTVQVGGNLPADTPVGEAATTSIPIFDSLGNPHELILRFENNSPNNWTLTGTIDGNAVSVSAGSVTFAADGTLTSGSPITVSGWTPPGADPLSFEVDLQGDTPIVQFGGTDSMEAFQQDGNAIGFLRDVVIGDDGTIVGQFSNGYTKPLGVVAMATFANPNGLMAAGGSRFEASTNSGEPLIGQAGTGNRGQMSAGTLEMSNVDLAQEFTNMIIAQRGFQANSRIITASDEILADLVNMKR